MENSRRAERPARDHVRCARCAASDALSSAETAISRPTSTSENSNAAAIPSAPYVSARPRGKQEDEEPIGERPGEEAAPDRRVGLKAVERQLERRVVTVRVLGAPPEYARPAT